MNTYCGTGLANPRNPRGLTLAWDHNVYAKKSDEKTDMIDVMQRIRSETRNTRNVI